MFGDRIKKRFQKHNQFTNSHPQIFQHKRKHILYTSIYTSLITNAAQINLINAISLVTAQLHFPFVYLSLSLSFSLSAPYVCVSSYSSPVRSTTSNIYARCIWFVLAVSTTKAAITVTVERVLSAISAVTRAADRDVTSVSSARRIGNWRTESVIPSARKVSSNQRSDVRNVIISARRVRVSQER